MARITVEDCIDKFESRFELVLVAANRARKIHSGESPTVEKDNDKNTVIALREIADETIPVDVLKEKLVEEYQAVSMQDEEDLSLEYSDTDEENKDDKNLNENNSEESVEHVDLAQEENDENKNLNENNSEESVEHVDLVQDVNTSSLSDGEINNDENDVLNEKNDLSQNIEEE